MSRVVRDTAESSYCRANISVQYSVYDMISDLGAEYLRVTDHVKPEDVFKSISYDSDVAMSVDKLLSNDTLKSRLVGKHADFEVGLHRLIHQASSAAKGKQEDHSLLVESNRQLTDGVEALRKQVATLSKANSALVTLFIIMSGGVPPESVK